MIEILVCLAFLVFAGLVGAAFDIAVFLVTLAAAPFIMMVKAVGKVLSLVWKVRVVRLLLLTAACCAGALLMVGGLGGDTKRVLTLGGIALIVVFAVATGTKKANADSAEESAPAAARTAACKAAAARRTAAPRKAMPYRGSASWTQITHLSGADVYECSACGAKTQKLSAYCPSCGSRMEKVVYEPSWVEEAEMLEIIG